MSGDSNQIHTGGLVRDQRYWGIVRLDGRAYEFRADLQGYSLEGDRYLRRSETPCENVVIMDGKHARVSLTTEERLVHIVSEHYQGLHDETSGSGRHVARRRTDASQRSTPLEAVVGGVP